MEQEKKCCDERRKEREDKEYRDLIHRLNRIEGQIRGIQIGRARHGGERCLLYGYTDTGFGSERRPEQF